MNLGKYLCIKRAQKLNFVTNNKVKEIIDRKQLKTDPTNCSCFKDIFYG